MLMMILSSIFIGIGAGLSINEFMDIIGHKRKGSVWVLLIGILFLIVGVSVSYAANLI